MFRKLVTNFALLSGGEAISKIITFVAFAYLARLFGPDIYGDIEFALAVTLFFNLVVEGGLGILGAREIAKGERSVVTLTFHIVVIRFAFAIVAFLFLLIFVVLSNKSFQEKQLLILYGITLFGTPALIQWVYQGLDQMQWVALSSIIRWFIFAGLVFFYVLDPAQAWMVPLIELGAILCVIAFNFGIFHYSFGHFWQKFDISLGLHLFHQALPIGLTQVAWGLRTYLPIIILGLLMPGEVVGWFGAAHRVIIALHTFVWMYFFNLYPAISRCTKHPPEAFQRLLEKSLQITSWSGIFIGTAGTLLAEPLMKVVYGLQYDKSAAAFKILIWLIPFILVSGHYMYSLFAYNKQWHELLTDICGALITIFMTPLLILKYGFIGAAYAVLFTEAVVWGLNYYFVRSNIVFVPFFSHLTKPLIAGSAMTVVLLILPQVNFFVMGITSFVLYSIGMLILQPNIINDIRVLMTDNR